MFNNPIPWPLFSSTAPMRVLTSAYKVWDGEGAVVELIHTILVLVGEVDTVLLSGLIWKPPEAMTALS